MSTTPVSHTPAPASSSSASAAASAAPQTAPTTQPGRAATTLASALETLNTYITDRSITSPQEANETLTPEFIQATVNSILKSKTPANLNELFESTFLIKKDNNPTEQSNEQLYLELTSQFYQALLNAFDSVRDTDGKKPNYAKKDNPHPWHHAFIGAQIIKHVSSNPGTALIGPALNMFTTICQQLVENPAPVPAFLFAHVVNNTFKQFSLPIGPGNNAGLFLQTLGNNIQKMPANVLPYLSPDLVQFFSSCWFMRESEKNVFLQVFVVLSRKLEADASFHRAFLEALNHFIPTIFYAPLITQLPTGQAKIDAIPDALQHFQNPSSNGLSVDPNTLKKEVLPHLSNTASKPNIAIALACIEDLNTMHVLPKDPEFLPKLTGALTELKGYPELGIEAARILEDVTHEEAPAA